MLDNVVKKQDCITPVSRGQYSSVGIASAYRTEQKGKMFNHHCAEK
jgi:hypothetical protein